MLLELKVLMLHTYFTVSSTNYAFGTKSFNATYLCYSTVTTFITHFFVANFNQLPEASKVLIMPSEVKVLMLHTSFTVSSTNYALGTKSFNATYLHMLLYSNYIHNTFFCRKF